MATCGNFLEYAGSKCGLDVGYGKLILVYANKTSVIETDLKAVNINESIVDGVIIGVIKGWHTIAGASVGEVSAERVGTGEMKMIREEIAADVLTFEASLTNREVISDLIKAGSLNCILIDDQGNAFGDYSSIAGTLGTMLLNFSAKTTSSLQHDHATDKNVAVTVRYLVKNLSVVLAGTETELVESKTLLVSQFVSYVSDPVAVITLRLKNKSTNDFFDGGILALNINVKGTDGTLVDTATYNAVTGNLVITMDNTLNDGIILVNISGDGFYMKETQFILTE